MVTISDRWSGASRVLGQYPSGSKLIGRHRKHMECSDDIHVSREDENIKRASLSFSTNYTPKGPEQPLDDSLLKLHESL
jgi:hypothetical protein